MAAPTLVNSYFVQSSLSGDSTALTTSSFTPSNGEVLVIKAATWDSGTTIGAPSGGSQTYTQRAVGAPGGFACYTVIYTAVVSGSPGSMTVSTGAPSASCFHTMIVERWSGAQLAATPATSSPIHGASAPLATITTTANNSIVTWVNADDNSSSGAGVYRSGAVEENVGGAGGTSSVHYYAYQTAASAGTQTIGMTAPLDPSHGNTQNWTMTGIEVQAASTPFPPATSSAFMTFFQ